MSKTRKLSEKEWTKQTAKNIIKKDDRDYVMSERTTIPQ